MIASRSPEATALISSIAADLERQTDEISDALVEVTLREIGTLRAEPDLGEQLLVLGRASVGLIGAMARAWTDPVLVPPPEEAIAYAQALVDRGLPIEALLRVYRIGQTGYLDRWYSEIDARQAPAATKLEAVRAISQFVSGWVDAISDPLISAYSDAESRRAGGAQALRTETTKAILAGEFTDVARASERLGYEVNRPLVGGVLWWEHADGDEIAQTGTEIAREVLRDTRPLLVQLSSKELAVWAPAPPTEQETAGLIAALRKRHSRLAIGMPGHGLEGFRRSHEQAMRAKRVGRLLSSTPLIYFENVAAIDLLTQDVAAARAFAREVLGQVGDGSMRSRRLLATLETFYREGSVSRTSEHLGVHENTISNRLKRAGELINSPNVEHFHTMVAVRLSPLLSAEAADKAPNL